jgi:hypothetical protein
MPGYKAKTIKRLKCLLFHWDHSKRTYSVYRFEDGRTTERMQCGQCGLWWGVFGIINLKDEE